MNKVLALLHLFPNADPLRDFSVVEAGTEWEWLTPDGKRPTREVVQSVSPEIENGAKGIDFGTFIPDSEMVEGVHYRVVNHGQRIVAWNLPDPQPTEAKLQTVWEQIKDNPTATIPQTKSLEDQLAEAKETIAQLTRDKAQLELVSQQNTMDLQGLMNHLEEKGVL